MINAAGAELITRYESIRLHAYKCPAGVWTIGRGHTKGVREGDVINASAEVAQFQRDMNEWEQNVRAYLRRQPNENQLAAFISFAFNVGIKGFASSSVLKAFERFDDDAAARSFMLWDKATVNGKKVSLPGLTARRAAEAALYLLPDKRIMPEMPQDIAPEKTMVESSINRTAVIAGSGTAMATLTTVADAVNQLNISSVGYKAWILPIILVGVLVAIGFIILDRYDQRNQGRA